MDETVGEVVSSFRPQAPSGRFDKEYDMAGVDDIGHYDKEYGKSCQVVTMVECVGEFDFFSSATCFLMKKMKNNVIVGNTGHIDKEIDVAGLSTHLAPGTREFLFIVSRVNTKSGGLELGSTFGHLERPDSCISRFPA